MLKMVATTFLVPYAISRLALPSPRGRVSVSSLWHWAGLCDCLNYWRLAEVILGDFWAQVLEAEQLLPGSHTAAAGKLLGWSNRMEMDMLEVHQLSQPQLLESPSPGTSHVSELVFR